MKTCVWRGTRVEIRVSPLLSLQGHGVTGLVQKALHLLIHPTRPHACRKLLPHPGNSILICEGMSGWARQMIRKSLLLVGPPKLGLLSFPLYLSQGSPAHTSILGLPCTDAILPKMTVLFPEWLASHTSEPGPSSIYTQVHWTLRLSRDDVILPTTQLFSQGQTSLQPLLPQTRLLTTRSMPAQILLH